MAKDTLTVTVRIDGLFETLRALSKLPKDAQNELRTKTLVLSKELAARAVASGVREGSQAALVSTTVKARRDRVPVIVAGGMKRLGSNRKPAFKLLFGSEFGAHVLKQYKRHIGNDSYWFFKTVKENERYISDAWNEVADSIINDFRSG